MTDTAKVAPEVDAAVQAFRESERARLLADKKERDHLLSVQVMVKNCPEEQREAYFRLTEEIREDYDKKREKEGL